MTTTQHCNRCGALIDAAAPDGFCPSCLLESGLLGYEEDRPPIKATVMRDFGDYELMREIGRGGMGVVYEARHKKLNRVVALKVILVGQWASDTHVSRFTAEAQAAAKLDHPGIVPIYEVGDVHAQHYFTMQLVRGDNLADSISNAKPRFSNRKTAVLLVKLARAVHYAHQQGVLHRDLKPSNILLDEAGEPHLMDFGLAKVIERGMSLTHTAAVLGTPSYMAPEQASGSHDDLTTSADIYSLGAILYELLTGRPPFIAETPLAIVRQVLEAEPIPPRRIETNTDRDLETICLKCLSKEPDARYESANALADDLQRWLEDKPITARSVAPAEKLYRWARRKPVSALSILLGIALAGLAGFAVYQGRRSSATVAQHERRSYLLQARETRIRGEAGRRFASLELLARAAAIAPSLELRNEAIACLALTDLHPERRWPGYPPGATAMAFNADLERYAVAQVDGQIVVRNSKSDAEVARLPAATVTVAHLIFSPNSESLAAQYQTADSTAFTRIWKVPASTVVLELALPSVAGAITFSPDNKSLAIGTSGSEIRLFELPNGATTRTLGCGSKPKEIKFDHSGARLAALLDGHSVVVFDLAGTNEPLTLSHPTTVTGFDWDPDRNHIAVACADWKIHLWRFRPSVSERTFAPDQSLIQAIGFAHSGWNIATASADGTLRLWDTTSGEPLVARFAAGTSQLQFDPEDRRLGFSLAPPEITIWKVADGHECRTVVAAGQYSEALSFTRDGRILACAHGSGVWFYDLDQVGAVASPYGALSKLRFDTVNAIFFEHDSQHLITSGSRGVYRWPIRSTETDAELLVEVGPPREIPAPRENAERQAALSGNGRIMATVGVTPRVVIGAVDGPAEAWKVLNSQYAHSLALSEDGRWLAAAPGRLAEINVFDCHHHRRVASWVAKAGAVAFAPGDKWLLTATPGDFTLWNPHDWSLHFRLPRPVGEEAVGPAAFSPDGSVLALAFSARKVRLVNPQTAQELATLEAPRPSVIRALAFSPDNTRLAVLTTTEGIQVWDLRRIRGQLASMRLDLPLPPYAASPSSGIIKPIRIAFNEGP